MSQQVVTRMQDLASEFSKIFRGWYPRTLRAGGEDDPRTQHPARPLAQAPRCWDLGSPQLFSHGCAPAPGASVGWLVGLGVRPVAGRMLSYFVWRGCRWRSGHETLASTVGRRRLLKHVAHVQRHHLTASDMHVWNTSRVFLVRCIQPHPTTRRLTLLISQNGRTNERSLFANERSEQWLVTSRGQSPSKKETEILHAHMAYPTAMTQLHCRPIS